MTRGAGCRPRQLRADPGPRGAAGWRSRPLLALLLGGCTIITDFQSDRLLEQTEERCSDRADNDGNGLTDCADPSCKIFDFCHETSEARCADGVDNDADGQVDCRDDECCGHAACAAEPTCGERTAAACTDGIDNDGSGLTDCADFSCDVPECCTRLVPLIGESFGDVTSSCSPPDCASLLEECCDAPFTVCNVLDAQRWLAWGSPSPRVVGGALTPNQICPTCGASGVVSVADTELSTGLLLELEADLHGEAASSLAVGLVDQALIPQSTEECGGVAASFPLLVGFSLSGSQVEAVIGGLVRSTTAGRTTGRQRARLEVAAESIRFYLDDKLFHEAAIKMRQPYPRVRVLIEGWAATATVDNVLLARRGGCQTPARWDAGPPGPGPALSPSGDSKRFDASTVSDPSVLFDGAVYRLYYTGGAPKTTLTRLGLAISTDGLLWTRQEAPLDIAGEEVQSLAEPAVIAHEGQYLMAYTSRVGDLRRIALASSSDGQSWIRMATVVSPGDSTAWDGMEVGSPALAYFRHRLHVWYVGRGSGSSLPELGLATSDTGTLFTRDPRNPVFVPTVGARDDRGVTDPWVLPAGATLQLWYVGLTWGGQTQINFAASEDGKNWIRYPQNPVVAADDPHLFGSAGLRGPTLLDRWGTLHLWYGGTDPAGLPAVGYAVNTGMP